MISDIVVIQIKPCPEIKIPDPAFSAILYTTTIQCNSCRSTMKALSLVDALKQ
jgi:hypothetical protein